MQLYSSSPMSLIDLLQPNHYICMFSMPYRHYHPSWWPVSFLTVFATIVFFQLILCGLREWGLHNCFQAQRKGWFLAGGYLSKLVLCASLTSKLHLKLDFSFPQLGNLLDLLCSLNKAENLTCFATLSPMIFLYSVVHNSCIWKHYRMRWARSQYRLVIPPLGTNLEENVYSSAGWTQEHRPGQAGRRHDRSLRRSGQQEACRPQRGKTSVDQSWSKVCCMVFDTLKLNN